MSSLRRLIAITGVILYCGYASAAPVGSFTVDNLLALLSDTSITHLSEVVRRLPDYLRESYVLVGESRSLQGATREQPRIVLFTPFEKSGGDEIMMAFNGDKSKAGYGFLEVIQFRRKSGRYEFRRIDFPADTNGSGPPIVSAPNPAQCKGCHTPELRPNWGTYPIWQGAIPLRDSYTAEEWRALEQFWSSAPAHPRYSSLRVPADPLGFIGKAQELENLLVWQAGRYGTGWAMASPRYRQYRYAIAAALADCETLPSFLPPGEIAGAKEKWATYRQETAKLGAHYQSIGVEEDHLGYTQRVSANLRFLYEPRGLSVRHLSYSFDFKYPIQVKGPYVYTNFLQALGKEDPELGSSVTALEGSVLRCAQITSGDPCTTADRQRVASFCAETKRASLKAFAGESALN